MRQKNKFDDFERSQVVALLDILFPNSDVPLREGNVINFEPDGIINLQNEEIGIEVRRFSESLNLQREFAIKRMQLYLNNSLSSMPSNILIQIEGNKIPIEKKFLIPFTQKVNEELLKVIPNLSENRKIEIDGVSINIEQTNNKNLNVHFSLSSDPNILSYTDAVINAFEEKNANTYSTNTNWLLLCESGHFPHFYGNFEKITNHISSGSTQFQKIFILTSWRAAGIENPDAIQIYPIHQLLYRKQT